MQLIYSNPYQNNPSRISLPSEDFVNDSILLEINDDFEEYINVPQFSINDGIVHMISKPIPLPPNNLDYSLIPEVSLIISWDVSTHATDYALERKLDGEGYSIVYIGSDPLFNDGDLLDIPGTYYYRVRAFNLNGYSIYSTEIEVNVS